MPGPIISVQNLSKRYLVGHRAEGNRQYNYRALRDVLGSEMRNFGRKTLDVLRGRQVVQGDSVEEFWALKDVNFEVQEGEVLGVIGRNGAGKSTLLKILGHITEPTSGRITLRGRVASLLEVGTGFHPELSGRENIYLNGAILGMRRSEVRRKFDEIVAFAEVEKFLDTPVKRYSSGMYVRLAFAVAAHLEPEILIIDEVLAVGDVEFQKKCLGKMDEVSRGQGRTVLFVSHNMTAIAQLTDRAICLSGGQISFAGSTSFAIDHYMSKSQNLATVEFDVRSQKRGHDSTGAARVEFLRFARSTPHFDFGEPISFNVQIRAERKISGVRINMTIFTAEGTPVGSSISPEIDGLSPGEHREMSVTLPSCRLAPGTYHFAVAIGYGNNFTTMNHFDVITNTLAFEIRAVKNDAGDLADWNPRWGAIWLESALIRWDEKVSIF